MIKKILCVLLVVFASVSLFAQSGAIKGKVLDSESGEAIPFANIVVEQNGNQIGGGVSDFDGNYTIKPVPAGRFTVKASYVGYTALQVNDVIVYNDQIRFLDLKLTVSTKEIEEVQVVAYTVPLISKDNTQQGGTVTSEEISKMAGRSPEAVASTVGGVYQEDGQVKSIRGSRDGATVYYIDGVKVTGSNNLPKASIAEVSVVTGGLPAKYGDATGGVISIVTKGASKTYFGGFELTTSKFLDDYNENILGFNLSGPILTKKVVDPYNPDKIVKEPLLGFFVAGEGTLVDDDHPSAVGVWKAKDNIIDSISRTPLLPSGDGATGIPTAAYLTSNDFENLSVRQNVAKKNGMLSGKIDFQPSKNLVFTLGGNVNYQTGRDYTFNYYSVVNNIGQGNGEISYYDGVAFANQIFNSKNNPEAKDLTYRTYLRMTQKFGNINKDEESSTIIKNAYYTIQADYSKRAYNLQSAKHKDNLFEYGHVGKFTTYKRKSYEYGTDTTLGLTGYIMNNFEDTLVTFEPGTVNPEMTRYTELYYDYFGNPSNFIDIQGGNGLLNGEVPDPIYNLVQVPGQVFDQYYKFENEQFRISALGSADIKDHEIQLGFEFEKRTSREYNIKPGDLWGLARRWANNHILELDLTNPIEGYIRNADGSYFRENGNLVFNDTIEYNRLYNANAQALFDLKLRDKLGLPGNGTDWIDVDSYDPSMLSIEYFSPDELFNNGNSLVSNYYGFDIYGNKLSSKPTFDDFFTKTAIYTSNDGITKEYYIRERAPFEPIYTAGFIQDKFAFNDLIFNIGLRVDRYDANQKIQKDPYLIYENYTVGDNDPKGLITNTNIPSNIKDGAAVYVDNRLDPKSIVGYRSDDQWYDASGNEISDPQSLYRNGTIQPYLVNPGDRPGDETFLSAFKDYKPVISMMPRISFSFPISDEALFFAHYDILTRRPTALESRLNPYDYLFIEQLANTFFSNSNLKPEKTIDYEIGFQQKLSNSSSLKLSAFVREQRDMIQVINLLGAYPINMKTYGNIDFGTVKGFTATYDLRRTQNIQFKASYTLQFASATGSDASTGFNLINSGQPNLRTTFPTDFDQRHQINLVLDYRFGEGKEYNGPKWFGTDVFSNAGCNFVIQTGSGTPYTKRDINTDYVIGSINGSYMPWRTSVNVKFDKSFTVKFGKNEDGNDRMADLNVYCDISNLLNTKNILKVYSYTGNANDDGYLNASKNQTTISTALDPESYRNYYLMLVNNPARYTLPRRIRLGLIFSF